MRETNGFFWQTPIADDFYRKWRDERLSAAEAAKTGDFVEIGDLSAPSEAERSELIRRCAAANLALYATDPGRPPIRPRSLQRSTGSARADRPPEPRGWNRPMRSPRRWEPRVM